MENCLNFDGKMQPLGLFANQEKIFLYHREAGKNKSLLRVNTSRDGIKFDLENESLELVDRNKRRINIEDCANFHIASVHQQHVLTFTQKVNNHLQLNIGASKDLYHWTKRGQVANLKESGVIVPNYEYQGNYVMYAGETSIRIVYSKNLLLWETGKKLLQPHEDYYGKSPVKVAQVLNTNEGILLLYYLVSGKKNSKRYTLKAALFDKDNPDKLLKKYGEPIWEFPVEWANKSVTPLGVVKFYEQLISYWLVDGVNLFSIFHPLYKKRIDRQKSITRTFLQKLHHNPILGPILNNFWESRATFNPAALYEDGKVHLVYRAIGDDDISVLGYAQSHDGLHIHLRHPKPIYVPSEPFELSGQLPHPAYVSPYASGGGAYGGCEDPRLTKIGNKIYMTYVAYNGWSPPRIALTSISTQDFLAQKWNWQKPVLISPPGLVDKNACILPEKINGKYVIFHRIFPNILIDFVDSLDFDGQTWLKGEYKIAPRKNYWDSRKLGAGPPPLKTADGWLLIYQAVDDRNDRQYKIGAMLLDLADPTKVLYRTNQPMLEPTHWYENVGHKAGVAYPCGAVNIDQRLLIYYGGADTVTCVAQAQLDEFVTHLKSSETTQLESIHPIFVN